MAIIRRNEKNTGVDEFDLQDDDGSAISKGTLDAALLTIYLSGQPTVRLRSCLNLLTYAGFSEDGTTAGHYYVTMTSADALIKGFDLAVGSGAESHILFYEFQWNSSSSYELTDPLATTAGSTTVRVTDENHGLQVGDGVFFVAGEEVGGRLLSGREVVSARIDEDTYEFEHRIAATETATGGGTTQVFLGGKYMSDDSNKHSIKRNDPS